MYTKRRCKRIDSDKSNVAEEELVVEVPVTIFVNGRQAVTAMASPEMLNEYAIGFLRTEGVIEDADEIESVQVEGTNVSILTRDQRKIIFSKKTVLSGCGGTATDVDYSRLPFAPSGRIFTMGRIHDAVLEIESSGNRRSNVEIQHAGIFTENETISVAGDIGKENALDKAIGLAVVRKVDLKECFAAITGRISSEIIRKCLFAQIPVIVSSDAITSLGYDIALERDMTVVGCVSSSGMDLYTGEHRIGGKPE